MFGFLLFDDWLLVCSLSCRGNALDSGYRNGWIGQLPRKVFRALTYIALVDYNGWSTSLLFLCYGVGCLLEAFNWAHHPSPPVCC